MGEKITELSCNMDDMTGEELGYAMDLMISEGALDAYATPVFMKKGRPGYLLTVLCKDEDKDRFAGLIFRHTTTIGIRITEHARYVMERVTITRDTAEGMIHSKISEGFGVSREKYEFEDLKEIAQKHGISIREARELLQ